MARPGPRAAGTRAKVLLVRRPVKSVRRADHPDPRPLRLAVAVIAAAGAVGLVWLLGSLGFELGFAPLLGVPELSGGATSGLATGARVLMGIPETILQAGLASPMLLMLGFALIAIPAAGLSAVRPKQPGGPKPSPLAVLFTNAGVIGAGLNALILMAWLLSPMRQSLISPLPDDPSQARAWLEALQTAGGMDLLAVIIAALWVVLSARLEIRTWKRALCLSASCAVLVIMVVAMAGSGAAAALVNSGRSLCRIDVEPRGTRLVLGSTDRQLVTLLVREQQTLIELRDRPVVLEVIGERTIPEFLAQQADAQR